MSNTTELQHTSNRSVTHTHVCLRHLNVYMRNMTFAYIFISFPCTFYHRINKGTYVCVSVCVFHFMLIDDPGV